MVRCQAVEAFPHQVDGDRPAWAARKACIPPGTTLVDDRAESIRIHQRGCTKRAARQLRCRRTRGHSDRRAGRGGAGSRLTEEC